MGSNSLLSGKFKKYMIRFGNYLGHDIIPACYLNSILTTSSGFENNIPAVVLNGKLPVWELILGWNVWVASGG